jgi:hypothetical protein
VSEQVENVQKSPRWRVAGFWRLIAVSFISVMLVAAVMNYLVNPYGIYSTELLPRVETNIYEKKLDLYGKFDEPIDTLIIGSSRAFDVDPDLVEELTGQEHAFNFSVPGAKAETFYAILRYVLDRGSPVSMVVLAVDPESFHPTMPIQPESVYVDEIAQYCILNPEVRSTSAEKVSLLFTLDQTGESINSLEDVLKSSEGQVKWLYRDNGYADWVQREREIEEGTYDLESKLDSRVRKYPDRSLMLPSFTHLGETRMEYWEDLLALCDERGIMVYAYLPAYHPRLYDELMNLGAGDILGQVSDYLESTVTSHGGIYRNYMNIESFGGNPEFFYDEIHMRPENAALLIQALLGDGEPGAMSAETLE